MLNIIQDKFDRKVYQTFCQVTHVEFSMSFGTNLIGNYTKRSKKDHTVPSMSFWTNLIGNCIKLSAKKKKTYSMLDVIWDKSDRVVYQTFCKITHVVSSISFGTNLIGKSVPNFLQ